MTMEPCSKLYAKRLEKVGISTEYPVSIVLYKLIYMDGLVINWKQCKRLCFDNENTIYMLQSWRPSNSVTYYPDDEIRSCQHKNKK